MSEERPSARAGVSHRAWSPDEDRRLLERYRSGATFAQIGEELARGPGSIATRLGVLRGRGEVLEVRRARWSEADRERLAQRYREGATRPQLCAEFGRARGTIGRQLAWMRAHGYDLSRSDRVPRAATHNS